jgi:type I restriction enzyme, S subunit
MFIENVKEMGMGFNNWDTVKLKELCTKIGSGATPRGGKEAYFEKGEFSLIRSQNVLDFTFSNDGLAYINAEQAYKLDNVVVEERDVLLNITGDSVARVCQVPKEVLPARVNQHVAILRPDKNQLSPEFLKYYVLSPAFKSHMLSLASVGGTRNALTKGMIEEFEIPLPPLPTQRRIAAILSAFDDKIELNRRMNRTLEAIAQAVFQEWFVRFNWPGATGEMVETELGVAPKGWRIVSFEEVFDVVRGLSYKGEGLTDESGVPMHNLNSIYEGGGYKFEGIKYYKGDYKDKHLILPGDVIVANTEQGHKYLLIGFPAIVPSNFGEESIISHHIYRVTPKAGCYLTSDFIFHLLLQPQVREQIIGFCNGTTVNMLKIEGLLKPSFILPPKELLEKFSLLAQSIRHTSEQNFRQSQTHTQLRDRLLPRLMRGEIEV